MCSIFGKLQGEKLIIGKSFDWVQYGGNVCFVPSYRSYGVSTIGCCFIEQMWSDRAYEGINEKKFSVFIEQNFKNKYDFNLEKYLRIGKFSVDFVELKLNTKVLSRKRNKDYSSLEIF